MKNLKIYKINNYIVFANLSIFIIFGFIFYFFAGGKTYLFTTDFHFYHSFANNFFGDFASSFSEKINDLGALRENWKPSFFYSIVFLSPITLFGSKDLFFLEGLVIGSIIICNLYNAVYKLNNNLSEKNIFFILLFTILFPSFLIETITVSTNSVFFLFGLLAFNSKTKINRILFLVICSVIRPNFIIILISIFIATLIYKPKGFKFSLLSFIPSIVAYLIAYQLNFSDYPGSGFNYLLMAEDQHISVFHNYSNELFKELLSERNIESIMLWDANLFELVRLIISSDENFTYFINLLVTKISLTLGYLHDGLTYSQSGLWFIKLWRTLHFIIISLPSFYLSILGLFLKRFSDLEKTSILSSLIFVILNSSLLGVPKYFVGIHFIFAYSFVVVIKDIKNLNFLIRNN